MVTTDKLERPHSVPSWPWRDSGYQEVSAQILGSCKKNEAGDS